MIASFIMHCATSETGMDADEEWEPRTGWVLEIKPSETMGRIRWFLRIDFRDGTKESYYSLPLTADEAALLRHAQEQDWPVSYRFSVQHARPLSDIRLATPDEVSHSGA